MKKQILKTSDNLLSVIEEENIVVLECDKPLNDDFKNKLIELHNNGYISIEITYPHDYETYMMGYSTRLGQFINDGFILN